MKAVAPVASSNAQVVMGSGNTSTSINGTTAGLCKSLKMLRWLAGVILRKRTWIAAQESLYSVRQSWTNLLGDANASVIGKIIKINNVPFQVIGVTTATGSTGMQSSDDMITAPITTVQARLIGKKTVRSILVSASSADLMQTAQDEITAALHKAHKIPEGKD